MTGNRKPPGRGKGTSLTESILFLVILGVGIVFILPFIWMIVVSFERYANIQPPFPPSFIIREPSLFNFKIILENGIMLRAYRNSFLVAVLNVVVCLGAVLPGAYALSKGTFRGKNFIALLILSTMMVPFETRMIPMFVMFNKVKLTNTFVPLILPSMLDAFSLFLAKGYFDSLPDSLAESAEIDGAGKFRIFRSIFLPLTTPILATVVILRFMGSWNSFLWPRIILTGGKTQTVPLYVSVFIHENGVRLAGSTMTVAFLGIIPVLIVFLFLQKYIIQSIALSGLKGE
ncbi:MAG: carbohydrate ABC transporter permease [Spirochaetaceae bacterium]|jgi:multiple sugar transport system permease protein|nr:carbohydrate ABC transporter permease [Spirochaetaceae bacterium]